MIKSGYLLITIGLFVLMGCESTNEELKIGQVSIIPKPVEQIIGEGFFKLIQKLQFQ